MKKAVSQIFACVGCWAAVLAICFGLLCAAAAIPNKSLENNLIKSSDKLAADDPHGQSINGLYHSVCDNYADAVLLGVAANMSSDSIIKSAIDTKYYDDGYGPAVGIRATIAGENANNDYTRYWHGSLVIVRPLLALTDLNGVRIFCSVIIALLIALNAFLLIRKKHTAACVIFLIGAILVEFWFVFTTLEYMTVFIIMLAALPLYVRFAEKPFVLAVISAGVGTLTAFADFLTAETLTILVPLTVSYFVIAEKGEKPDNKKSLITAISCMAAWGASYLLTFATKWITASMVLGRDVSEVAVSAAKERISGMEDNITSSAELLFKALGANFTMLSPVSDKINIVAAIIWLAAFAAVCLFIYRTNTRKLNLPKVTMILIAALPVIRFCVLMNHSYMHNYFTYRALMPSIMAAIGLMWYRVDGTKSTRKKTARK